MRGNRKMLVASKLFAIPFACLMSSAAMGQSPTATQAAFQSTGQSGKIAQVADQQTKQAPTKTAPNLFYSLAANNSHNQIQHNTESRGILSGLFGRSSSSNSTSSSHTQSRTASTSQATADRAPADWSGIPYHRGTTAPETDTRTPIRDPRQGSTARVIRGRAPAPLQASPVSTPTASSPKTASRVPTPPSDSVLVNRDRSEAAAARPTTTRVIPRETFSHTTHDTNALSSETSSRRSGRRSLEALDPAEIAPAAKSSSPAATAANTAAAKPTPDLVPKVVRREIESAESVTETKLAAKTKASVSESNSSGSSSRRGSGAGASAKVAAKPVPTPSAELPKPAVAKPEAAPPQVAVNPPAATPVPTPAAAPTPTPAPAVAKAPANVVAPTAPTAAPASLGMPAAAAAPSSAVATVPTPSADYQTPDSHLAPKSSAQTISHRAGPPVSAFGPSQLVPTQSDAAAASQIMAPVGSGLVGPSTDNADASSSGGDGFNVRTEKMVTYGQPVGVPQVADASSNSVTKPTRLHDMDNYGGNSDSSTGNYSGDNFAQPRYDSQRANSMRTGTSRSDGLDSQRELMQGQNSTASELPGIRVVTFGPGEIMIRQTQQYEIRVENRGAIDAQGVLVRAMIPDWAEIHGHNASQGHIDNQTQGSSERLVWTIDSLPAGSVERMFVRLRAERSGTHDLDVDWTMTPQHATATVRVQEPRLDLTIEGPEEVIYGQSQTYTVRVLNPGDGTAPNVVFTLSPNSATPQTQRIGDIPAGKEAQFEVELTAQDLVDLKIHGMASGDLDLRAEAEKTIRVASAKLEAVLTGPELKYQNTESLYNLQVQNTGSAISERIVATLQLPGGVKYLGGLEEAQLQQGALKWQINALAPGASRNYQFRCNMTATGDQRFIFDCKGSAAGQTGVALATRVESIADLVLTVNDPPAPAPIGADVTYEIIVRNRGSKEATDIRALAQFSHGIEPNKIEGQSGELLTGQVLFDPIPRIGAGQEVRLRVVAKADRAGHHRFRTEVRSGDTVLVAEEATHYMSPQSDRVSRRSTDVQTR
ncbi:hypothetical protein GCM10023156_57040 [Novipirellula rosea]|uniref:DUF11 domain-containing protein n=2 Tax=Novipirellula rosea TaxID=1031540 RepID=A0ABP8NKX5_9BACT